jgi:pSer/pThr/pTyr-binding forkhead associated (FHA) protein
VNADRPVISIGRGKENDLIIRNDLASRQQFSRGRCTITDNSTNGTVIFSKDDKSSHALKRESYTLDESSTIVLGQPSEVDDRHIVRFQSI